MFHKFKESFNAEIAMCDTITDAICLQASVGRKFR